MTTRPAANFALFPRSGKTESGGAGGCRHLGRPNGCRAADPGPFSVIFGTHSSSVALERIARVSRCAGGRLRRISAISRKISWNICVGWRTSAIWKAMVAAGLTYPSSRLS